MSNKEASIETRASKSGINADQALKVAQAVTIVFVATIIVMLFS